jgi:hypothetical protein
MSGGSAKEGIHDLELTLVTFARNLELGTLCLDGEALDQTLNGDVNVFVQTIHVFACSRHDNPQIPDVAWGMQVDAPDHRLWPDGNGLIVFLGANNNLFTVLRLAVKLVLDGTIRGVLTK